MRRYLLFIVCVLIFSNTFSQPQANSLNFDGIDDWVNLNSLSDTLAGSSNFSIEFWMKADLNNQTSSIRTSMFCINNQTLNGNRFLMILGGSNAQTGHLMIYDQGSWGTNSDFISSQVIGDNTCHHIAYTLNGTTGSIYIDGVLAGTHVANFTLAANDFYSLGQEWDNTNTASPNTSQFYNGFLRDIRIWNDTRTALEISQNMNTTLTGNEPDLLALYYGNDGFLGVNNASDTVLVDTTNNTFDGFLYDFDLTGCVSNWSNMACSGQSDSYTVLACPNTDTLLQFSDTSGLYSYNWYKLNTAIANTSTYDLTNVSLADTGNYHCDVFIGGCFYTRHNFYVGIMPPIENLLSADTVLCNNETLLLETSVQGSSYLWHDNSTDSSFLVNSPGSYWVTMTDYNGCQSADTINVSYDVLAIQLANDTSICPSDTLLLTVPQNGNNYLWHDNSTNSTYQANQSGVYWVEASNMLCTVRDSIIITHLPSPTVHLGNDTTLCHNQTLLLDVFEPTLSYIWHNNSTSSNYLVNTSGNYWVTVTDTNSCGFSDTITVSYSSISANLEGDRLICANQSLVLDVFHNGASYLWNDNSTDASLTVNSAGQYYVQVSDGTCIDSDTVNIDYHPDVTLNLLHPNQVCSNTFVSLTHDLDLSHIIASRWTLGDGQTSTNFYPSFQFSNGSGSISIMLEITTNNGCNYTYNSSIDVDDSPIAKIGFSPINPEIDQPINFKNLSSNYTTFTWHHGEGQDANVEELIKSYSHSGSYTVHLVANNQNCSDTAYANIVIKDKLVFYVPNVFIGGKGQNNVFQPIFTSGFDPYDFELTIFNRWGEVIFKSFNSLEGWDGTYGGAFVQDGVYVWQIRFGKSDFDEQITERGIVTFLR